MGEYSEESVYGIEPKDKKDVKLEESLREPEIETMRAYHLLYLGKSKRNVAVRLLTYPDSINGEILDRNHNGIKVDRPTYELVRVEKSPKRLLDSIARDPDLSLKSLTPEEIGRIREYIPEELEIAYKEKGKLDISLFTEGDNMEVKTLRVDKDE